MVLYMDYTSPSTQFTYDVNKSTFVRKDNQNYINVLGVNQLNTLENVSLLDIFLSTNNVIEPHYHQNAAELVYCISGAATVSIFNPFTKQIQNYPITPGQVANVPQGWWHYEVAAVDNTHLLAIFNAPTPEVILGSDILKLTPTEIMAHTYCMDENQWKNAIAPVQPSTFIGPPKNCNRSGETNSHKSHPYEHKLNQYDNHWYATQAYNHQNPTNPQYYKHQKG
jgi:oxalate decarboxylase/phosphoglucose isomerase-like protein (cupin superfamily)